MTLAEARAVAEGAYIASPNDNPAWRVRRVSRKWMNLDGSIVRCRGDSYATDHWLDLQDFTLCPKGYKLGDILKPEHRPATREPAAHESSEAR